MNFAITSDESGKLLLDMSAKGDPLLSAMVTSVTINKGAWWLNPGFGLDRSGFQKDTAGAAARLEAALRNATAWILEAGLAKRIDITTERAQEGRLNFSMVGHKPDGGTVEYENFVEVI